MKYLILIMFLFGCGVDPDDYKPEESDGCKSTDTECQAKKETSTDDTEEANTEEHQQEE